MNLTPEQMELGRRNFLKVLAGTPAMAALGAAAALRGPAPGGRVRIAFIGVGSQGRAQLTNVDPGYGDVRALCDINPAQLKLADGVLAKNGMPPARHYADWREMLQKEDVEAVIMAPPLWAHADLAVGCLDAGKHVLCEKMMAWDVESCERMRAAALRNDRVLEIGYQRNHNPMYQAAYDGIVKAGVLGDIYHVRLAWHRNGSWRRKAEKPSPDYDPSQWGYPTFDHLINWRLYWKYSQGLMAELCSHQVNAANWFLGAITGRGDRLGRTLPVPGKPGSLRSRLRHLRVSRRPHRRLLVDRIERVRRLLRDVHGNEGDVDHAARARGAPVRGGRQRPPDRDRGDTGREGCGGAVVRNHGGEHESGCHSSRSAIGGGRPRGAAIRDAAADAAVLLGDSRRHAAGLRSRQGHRLCTRLHRRERGDQDQSACQLAHDLRRLWLECGTSTTSCTPQGANQHLMLVERVVKVTSDSSTGTLVRTPVVGMTMDALAAPEARAMIGGTGLEFIGEDLGVRSARIPPRLLSSDILPGGGRESDLAGLQFERSSLRTSSASNEPTVGRIGIRLSQGLVQSRAVSLVEPVFRNKAAGARFRCLLAGSSVRRRLSDLRERGL